MATMQQIEELTKFYAAERTLLSETVLELHAEIDALKRRYLARIKRGVERAKEAESRLRAGIEAAPALFARPRTVVFHGIKVGYQKAKGVIEWDDEAAVIARIRKLLPEDQAEIMIRVKESVQKSAVYDLAAGDLKRLGIRIADDGDQVLIRDTTTDVDRLVEALLKEAPEEVEA